MSLISCTCDQWIQKKDSLADNREAVSIFLEPANKNLVYPYTMLNGERVPFEIIVTRQFYSCFGFPEGYNPVKRNPNPARVFRYEKIKK